MVGMLFPYAASIDPIDDWIKLNTGGPGGVPWLVESERYSYGPTPFWPRHQQGFLWRDDERLPMTDIVFVAR